MITILADIYATEYEFIDKKFAEVICSDLEIKSHCWIKLKEI